MGEYARVYGEDGFKMADGTHKITKYDMTFVLQLICIVMTNPNVKYPLIQYLDWFMTLMRMEMPVWFSFVINHI